MSQLEDLEEIDAEIKEDPPHGRGKPIRIGERLYGSKVAAAQAIRALLLRYPSGSTIERRDHAQFLLDLLRLHPEADQKIGCGVKSFEIKRNGRSLGFWLTRTDGTTTDWSYLACLSPPSRERLAMAALRSAIRDQVALCRDEAFAGAEEIQCAVTGARITRESCHVDHDPPFIEVVDQWLNAEGMALKDVRIYPTTDGSTITEMADPRQLLGWCSFHEQTANLRVVLASANMGWLRTR
jgi:hypothetical protein